MLPLEVYRSDGDDVREVAPAHPVARLFQRQPNDQQTPVEFVEMVTAHCLLRGNGFAKIVRDGRGAPVTPRPLHPDWVNVPRIPGTRRVVYDVSEPDMHSTRCLLPEEMLYLKDRSDDGIVGKSRLQRARETFGTAIAAETFAASTYRNQARVSGVLIHPEEISDEASKNPGDSFTEKHAGAKNAAASWCSKRACAGNRCPCRRPMPRCWAPGGSASSRLPDSSVAVGAALRSDHQSGALVGRRAPLDLGGVRP